MAIKAYVVFYLCSFCTAAQSTLNVDQSTGFLPSYSILTGVTHREPPEINLVESILNRVYFGNAQDMMIYRNTLLQSTNPMGLGMLRASIPIEPNLHLLMYKEYIYKVGMLQQTFQFTPYVGIRKRF